MKRTTTATSLTGCAIVDGRTVACNEVTDRLRAADVAERQGPGHRPCAAALRATARRISETHLAGLELREGHR